MIANVSAKLRTSLQDSSTENSTYQTRTSDEQQRTVLHDDEIVSHSCSSWILSADKANATPPLKIFRRNDRTMSFVGIKTTTAHTGSLQI